MENQYRFKNRKFQKLVYRFFDIIMVRSTFPVFGKIANKIRVFFARRISKKIDKRAFIDRKAFICDQVTIEKNGCVGSNCLVSPFVTIGEETMMGPEVLFFTMNHKRSKNKKEFVKGYDQIRPIIVGKNCWIGQRAIILGGVKIGDGATIGAGAVVTRDVPAHTLVVGNPAEIKKNYEK